MKHLRTIGLFVMLTAIFFASFQELSIVGVPSNFQGPNMYFLGVRITSPNEQTYWRAIDDTGFVGITSPYHPSDCEFNGHMTTIFLKPDRKTSELYSTMQSIEEIISSKTKGSLDVPSSYVAPEHVYVLKVQNYTNEKIAMYEFPAEAFLWFYATAGGYNEQNNYDVWIKIDLNQMFQNWYWEVNGTPASEVYFAIGKIQAYISTSEHYSPAYVNPANDQPLMLYFAENGSAVSSESFEKELKDAFEYGGGKLNPTMFRPEVFIHIELNNFGTHYANFWHTAWRGDATVIVLKFHIFVFGVWQIQDVQNIQPPKPSEPHGGFAFTWAFSNWWKSLSLVDRLGIASLLGFATLIGLAIAFPDLALLGIIGIGELRRRR